ERTIIVKLCMHRVILEHSVHVPGGESTLHWITQDRQQFHIREMFLYAWCSAFGLEHIAWRSLEGYHIRLPERPLGEFSPVRIHSFGVAIVITEKIQFLFGRHKHFR